MKKTIIKSKSSFFTFNLKEVFFYRDLVKMFILRDYVTFYKQTILGPLWYIIQPLVNTIVFTVIFGNLAKIPTDGLPPFIFYMAGNVAWAYFAITINTTSSTFTSNSDIFGKVYFPRLTVPIASSLIGLLQFFIQFLVFLIFYFYFYLNSSTYELSFKIFLLPFLLFYTAVLALGFGLIISSLTAKYRDLKFVMSFGVQLWMYATPIVYPLSLVPEKYRIYSILNPMTIVIESFREIFFQQSSIRLSDILIGCGFTIFIFIFGVLLFNKTEKNFMDTV